MVYLAIEWCIGTHGRGTHMWNLYYSHVQHQKRVSLATLFANLASKRLVTQAVHNLFRPHLQSIALLHQMLHPAPHPATLLLRRA